MKIILGVTGSIACYKSFDLARELVKQNHEVRVILSKGALKFIKPDLFRYLGCQAVYSPSDDFNLQKYEQGNVLHIELARWADRMIIAPASANYLAKLAHGLASDLLSSVFLSNQVKPVIIFPAMNTQMYLNPITQSNIEKLNSLSHVFVTKTATGLLACNEEGEGKLLPVNTILNTFDLFETKPQVHKKVLITTGATIAPLDPIRYMTNGSTGITGFYLAKKFLKEGYQVTVIAGKNSLSELDDLQIHPKFHLERVVTADDMKTNVEKYFNQTDLYISAAAVSDMEFDTSSEKIKKSELSHSLPIKPSVDILAHVLNIKTKQSIIGFAAETNTSSETFKEKYSRKKVDLLIGNRVTTAYLKKEAQGFGTKDGDYFFIKEGKVVSSEHLTKEQLADKVFNWYHNA
jgi:phosphopantothenoylcysteine decarboxylase/phosphopantothenate--cysteine ligase